MVPRIHGAYLLPVLVGGGGGGGGGGAGGDSWCGGNRQHKNNGPTRLRLIADVCMSLSHLSY